MKTILFLNIFFVIVSCQTALNNDKETLRESKSEVKLDTINYSTLVFDKTDEWLTQYIFPVTFRQTKLNSDEITELYRLLSKAVDEYNEIIVPIKYQKFLKRNKSKDKINISAFKISVDKYKKQFIPILNEKDQKIVWVNCFIVQDFWKKNDIPDWHNKIVRVFDGGNNFFNIKINLTLKTFETLRVNDGG